MEEEKSFAELLEAADQKPVRLKPGESVSAVIAKITADWIFIDLGGKTEGIVEKNEFLDKEGQLTVKEGDTDQGLLPLLPAWRADLHDESFRRGCASVPRGGLAERNPR